MDSIQEFSNFFNPASNFASQMIQKKLTLSPLRPQENESFILFSANIQCKQICKDEPEPINQQTFTSEATAKIVSLASQVERTNHPTVTITQKYYREEESSASSHVRQRCASNPWTAAEDECLQILIQECDTRQWNMIADRINQMFPMRPQRNSNQSPGIQKGKWSRDEDEQLIKALLSSPPQKWKVVADKIDKRTDIQVRYRVKKIAAWLLKNGVPKSYI